MGDEFCDGAGGVIFIDPGGGGSSPVDVPDFGLDFAEPSLPSFF